MIRIQIDFAETEFNFFFNLLIVRAKVLPTVFYLDNVRF